MVAGMGCNIIPAFIEKHVSCQVFTKKLSAEDCIKKRIDLFNFFHFDEI